MFPTSPVALIRAALRPVAGGAAHTPAPTPRPSNPTSRSSNPASRPTEPASRSSNLAPRAIEPAPRPTLPSDTLTLTGPAALTRSGEVRLAPGRDGLTVTVQAGDTLWNLASRWGAQGATRAYIEAIRQANGLADDTIQLGQPLRLPYALDTAGLRLMVALAIQKEAARHATAPALDLSAIDVGHGPLDSYLVTVPRRDGQGLRHFAVTDDLSGEDPFRWVVQPLSKRDFDARSRGEW